MIVRLAWVAVVLLVSSSAASAAVEQCRFIGAKVDREACYDRQAQSLALAKRKPELSTNDRVDPLDELKAEDDRLTKRLQGICKGC